MLRQERKARSSKNTRDKSKDSKDYEEFGQEPNMYTETFKGQHGNNAFCSTGWSLKKVYHAERCKNNMNDPICQKKCICELDRSPQQRAKHMDKSLFNHPRPFLVYSLYRGINGQRVTFMCKLEQEVFEYVNQLNANEKKVVWFYKEETVYNHAAIIDYENAKAYYSNGEYLESSREAQVRQQISGVRETMSILEAMLNKPSR